MPPRQTALLTESAKGLFSHPRMSSRSASSASLLREVVFSSEPHADNAIGETSRATQGKSLSAEVM
ncbi:Uncharacterised protein [Mycobacteroides abscessus subsp. abscessus]|nr:Uncharacterised protein [Mycobacteroides abscessus subsp. abscessus]